MFVSQTTVGMRTAKHPPNMFKTTMCRSWSTHGSCPYGTQCQFAHGRHELRPTVATRRVCRQFLKHNVCSFGHVCKFSHDPTVKSSVQTLSMECARMRFSCATQCSSIDSSLKSRRHIRRRACRQCPCVRLTHTGTMRPSMCEPTRFVSPP